MAGPLKNARQERFAQELAKGASQVEAYRLAGYKPNDGHAARLAGKGRIADRIRELQAKIAEKTIVDAAWLLDRLAAEVDADIADLYAEDGSLKPPKEWPAVWRKGLVAGLDVEEVREAGKPVAMVRKVRLSDRVKRLELIGKHISVQAFREQVAHSGEINVIISSDDAEL